MLDDITEELLRLLDFKEPISGDSNPSDHFIINTSYFCNNGRFLIHFI